MINKTFIIIGTIIIMIIIGFLFIKLNANNEIPNDYIAYASFPSENGTRTVYIYAKYDYENSPLKTLVVKYSYIEATTRDYRTSEKYNVKKGNLKDIDEVVSQFDNVILNIEAQTTNQEYKKGDQVDKEEFREILQNQEWQRMLN